MAVHRWNTALDGEFSESALRGKLEVDGVSGREATCIRPAPCFPITNTAWTRSTPSSAGRFRLIIGGHLAMLGPGDWVEVPTGVMHNASVIGDDPVVSLDAVKDNFPGSPRH